MVNEDGWVPQWVADSHIAVIAVTKTAQDSMGRKLFMMNIWRKQAEKLMDLRSNQKMARTLGMMVRQSATSSRERRLSR